MDWTETGNISGKPSESYCRCPGEKKYDLSCGDDSGDGEKLVDSGDQAERTH